MTTVLLDTHIVLWALHEPDRLRELRRTVEDPETTRLLSAAVVWEVAIKVGLGRLDIGMPVTDWAPAVASDLAAVRVPITDMDVAETAALEHHHRDPFDRLLVAQARRRQVPLLTADATLQAYDVEIQTPTG